MTDGQSDTSDLGFRQRLRAARIAAGLTPKQLAESAGVSDQAVRDWESGRSSPTVHTATALARVLRTSIASLVGEIPDLVPGAHLVDEEFLEIIESAARSRSDLRQQLCDRYGTERIMGFAEEWYWTVPGNGRWRAVTDDELVELQWRAYSHLRHLPEHDPPNGR